MKLSAFGVIKRIFPRLPLFWRHIRLFAYPLNRSHSGDTVIPCQHLVVVVTLLIVLYQTRISRAPDRTKDSLPRQHWIYQADVLPIACCRARFCLVHVDAILKNDFLKFWINTTVILSNTYLQKIHISCQVFDCYQMLHCVF